MLYTYNKVGNELFSLNPERAVQITEVGCAALAAYLRPYKLRL